jgi:hypothetical protein
MEYIDLLVVEIDLWRNRKAIEQKLFETLMVVVKGLDIEPAIAP